MVQDQDCQAAHTDSNFRLLDQGITRRDLASRREVKFTLPGADLEKLRHLLESNCRRLVYHDRISTVRSIYFDDVRFSACHANLDGIGKRRKVRLRWYDSLRPGTDFFLEIKWRDNRITGKHRFRLQSHRALGDLPYDSIRDCLIDAVPTRYTGDLLASSEPVAIVEYRREHFAARDGGLRVTLDYDLAFYDQTGRQFIYTSFPYRMHSLVVLEGKAPIGRESELRELFYPFTPRMGRCSKYVHGCRSLGFIPMGV